MSYVGHILAALLSLAAIDLGWSFGAERPYVVLLLAALPFVLSAGVRRQMLRGRFRTAAFGERLLSVLPVLLQWLAVSLFGWFDTLETHLGVQLSLESWPGLQLLYGLVPFLIYQVLAIDAGARLSAHPGRGRARARNFQLRFFVSAMVPFLAYLTLSSAIALSEVARIHVEEVAIFSAAFSLALVGLLVSFLPGLIQRTWETTPIERGWLREMLESVARQSDFRFRDLLLWRTGRQMSNAAIVGFTAKSRVVLFSDALLSQLQPDELAAVFTHEIGHARRGHIVTFASWSLFFLLGADVLVTWLGEPDPFVLLGGFVLVLTAWFFSFGYMSRRFELEADLESRSFFGESGPLIRALGTVSGSHGMQQKSWRHFSPAHRTRYLESVDLEPEIGRRLQRQLRRWARLGRVLCILILLVEGFQLAQSWTHERLTAELRLGNYARAMRLAESVRADLDPEVLELVDFADRLPPGIETDALEISGLREFAQGAIENASLYVELAILRGRRDLVPVLAALAGEDAGGSDALSERWRRAFGLDRASRID